MKSFGIIPAAGKSQRMGDPKLLLAWGKGRVIDSVLAAWRDSRVSHVVATVRKTDLELQAACQSQGVELVIPDADPPEMKHSVQLALDYICRQYAPGHGDVWLLAPADLPLLRSETIDALLAAYRAEDPAIFVPTVNGQRGHPVLFPWPLAAEAGQLAASEGVNALLTRHKVHEIPLAGSQEFDDLDTPDDYRRLRDRYDC